jgi:amidase
MNTSNARRPHGAMIGAAVCGWLALSVVAPRPAVAASKPTFDVVGKSIADLTEAQAQGRVTSEQLVDAYLRRIATVDRSGPTLHSVLAVNPQARADARALDRERAAGHVRGPLHGIPLLIKDNIETADPVPTTAGSLALVANIGGRDSPLVARLRAAGVIILGKTNLSEWANLRSSVSVSGWTAVGGQTRNPYALDRNPCGSSSGSAAAVAASLAPAAIGTETDGSITCPASMTGLVGIKPTVGLVSRTYVIPISHSQDTPGPITRTVADAALLLGVMAGSDALDPATHDADAHRADFSVPLQNASLSGLRIGVMRMNGTLPAVKTLVGALGARLSAAGAILVDVDPPGDADKMGDFELTVMLTEMKADLNKYLATTPPAVTTRTLADVIAFNLHHADQELPVFGQDLFERSQATTGLDDPAYVNALQSSRRMAGPDGLDKIMQAEHLQLLIAPTIGPAILIDPINGDAINGAGPGSPPAIVGYPHLTVPMGMVKGLPVGLSLIGPAWSDVAVLAWGGSVAKLLGPVPAPLYRRSSVL